MIFINYIKTVRSQLFSYHLEYNLNIIKNIIFFIFKLFKSFQPEINEN